MTTDMIYQSTQNVHYVLKPLLYGLAGMQRAIHGQNIATNIYSEKLIRVIENSRQRIVKTNKECAMNDLFYLISIMLVQVSNVETVYFPEWINIIKEEMNKEGL